jgi:predicted nucleic acid-binding protein
MTLVVDASVALKWYLIEDGAEPARQILADGDTLVAPELVVAEVCNACWLAGRRGEISTAGSDRGRYRAHLRPAGEARAARVPSGSDRGEIESSGVRLLLGGAERSARRALVTSDGRLLAHVAGTPFAGLLHGTAHRTFFTSSAS